MSTKEKYGSSKNLYGEIRSIFEEVAVEKLEDQINRQKSYKINIKHYYFDFSQIILLLENVMPEKIDEIEWVEIRNFIVQKAKEFENRHLKNLRFGHFGTIDKYLVDVFGPSISIITIDWFDNNGEWAPTPKSFLRKTREFVDFGLQVKKETYEAILDNYDFSHNGMNNPQDLKVLEDMMKDDSQDIDFGKFSEDILAYTDTSVSEMFYKKEEYLMPRFR